MHRDLLNKKKPRKHDIESRKKMEEQEICTSLKVRTIFSIEKKSSKTYTLIRFGMTV